jgi:adenine deaminase
MIRRAIEKGMKPATAVRLATLSPSEFYGFRDRGAVAPGYRADLVVLDSLESFVIDQVYKDGTLVVEKGEAIKKIRKDEPPPYDFKKLDTGPVGLERFQINDKGGEARVMELVPGQLYTRQALIRPKVEKGYVVPDIEKDILKIAVVERHHASGNTGLGLIKGFGLKTGALAASVSHDSHNIVGVCANEEDLVRAVQEVRDLGGGLVAVEQGQVLARVPLEIAGLLSLKPLKSVAEELKEINLAADSLGCSLETPFMALSFIALPVIPALKLTDLGLVDVNKFQLVSLFM